MTYEEAIEAFRHGAILLYTGEIGFDTSGDWSRVPNYWLKKGAASAN